MGRASRRKRERGKAGKAVAPGALRIPSRAVSRGPSSPSGPLSDALWKLIEPYRDVAETREALESLVALGALAWNMALFPELAREKHLLEEIQSLSIAEPDGVRDLVLTLARRKERLFPHDRRLIVEYKLTPVPSGFNLVVASTASE